jgi:eukaryotic-like serine/threonine-protein kinase
MESLRPGDPERIGQYLLYGRLGAGGMGEVFLGVSPGGKAVAVKLISPDHAGDDAFRERFRQEVKAGYKVGGFHAAQVVDADTEAARPWMVTAYVAGPSLYQVLKDRRALPPDTVRVLGAGLAEALRAIHAAGLIHRDLKPANILLAYDGPHVIDFGVARFVDASAHTTQPGTPGYIAPEVLTGQPATWACDVFALGVVLAQASGLLPFGEGGEQELNYRIVHKDPDLRGLDAQIRGLVEECLAKTPTDRPTPEQILQRLGGHGSVPQWLPRPVLDMIPGYAPPQPTEAVRPGPQHDSRLLDAERAARGIPDAYARAEAQVYVAAVVSRSDPDHALRLLDDALRPARQRDGTALSREQRLRHLTGRATFELGTVLARADAPSAGRLLDEIEGIVRSMIHV